MHPVAARVLIIEDETALRLTLGTVLRRCGYEPVAFADPNAFFDWLGGANLTKACLLLDMRLPTMSGLDVQERLEKIGVRIPIIFMSGNSEIGEAITGLKNGAVDFLLKPFNQDALIDAINRSLPATPNVVHGDKFRLSTRERLVLDYVARGWRSERIAQELGLSVRTIKMHRSNIIHKTGANTMTEAVMILMQQPATA